MAHDPSAADAGPRWLAGGVIAVAMAVATVTALIDLARYEAWQRQTASARAPVTPYLVDPWTVWPAWVHQIRVATDWSEKRIRPGLMVLGFGLTCLAFRGRSGRAGKRRIRAPMPGPGRVAAALIAGSLVLATLGQVRFLTIDQPWQLGLQIPEIRSLPPLFWVGFWGGVTGSGTGAGEAIGVAWIYLTLIGQWRRPVDLGERLGRGLGWTWIGLGAAFYTFEVFGIH